MIMSSLLQISNMSNQIDDKDDDFSANVVEPDENEWRKYIDE